MGTNYTNVKHEEGISIRLTIRVIRNNSCNDN